MDEVQVRNMVDQYRAARKQYLVAEFLYYTNKESCEEMLLEVLRKIDEFIEIIFWEFDDDSFRAADSLHSGYLIPIGVITGKDSIEAVEYYVRREEDEK